MGDLETSLIHTRKSCRIEQMVAKWLHRSRDSTARSSVPAMDSAGDSGAQPPSRVKVTVTVYRDLVLQHYGFEICPGLPLTIASVTAGSTADGKLQPGDQLLAINSSTVEGTSVERAASIIRDAGDELVLTVLRCSSGGPKSSFLTAEKRARLKTNPVKVRFAEEVLLNGHSQGSSLLFMPNVLKVYLENGQTKAFRFERSTTVKDIVLTLQEKLSIRSIAHFALVLEEQYNLAKIHLLHEEELIAQVVQKRDSHDYRCLFRVCFVPKDPLDLLQEDPVAFEYLYLQSCSDVLQERFAVEMKCSVALRLAALHIQERVCACAQPHKVSLKYIERDWGIENFISPTLLRNMRGKDIKKAISYHLKRNQVLLDPRQKHTLTAAQVRLSYLQILGELKMYSGKIFNATMMLQDRESYVALLVGAKHGVSQIVNSKLNIVSSLAEFPSISRVELSDESERVSTVKIYLQDLKVLTLLLESNSAKDLVCLIAGYYRLFVDANGSIFTWGEKQQQLHRVSAEEGYESRACSDSEDSCDSCSERGRGSRAERLGEPGSPGPGGEPRGGGGDPRDPRDTATDSASEASDSANTESRGFKTSGSSDSVDALEEDELEARSSSRPELFRFYTPTVQELSSAGSGLVAVSAAGSAGGYFCLLQVPGAEPGASPAGQGEPEPRPVSVLSGASPGCHSLSPPGPGHGHLVLRPPPGFGDSSSEEEFYDAADRLSPPDALAGKGTPAGCRSSWEGAESSSCIPKRLRCYSLGERHGQERELACTKSLRKRRSFLETDYTSQVSFPAAPPGSPQRCCSWLPTQPSPEDTGKDTETATIPVASQGQRDTAGTDPCSDLVDMEPGTTGTKPAMEELLPSVSDVCHPGDHCGEEDSSAQPQQPPEQPLPRGQSGAAQESSAEDTDPRRPSEQSCAPRGGCQAQGAPEEGAQVLATQHEESKGGQSCAGGQGSAGGESRPDGQRCARSSSSSSSQGAVSRASSPQVPSGDTLRKVRLGHSGLPEAAQLLAECGGAPRGLTRLSWLSFGVRTEPVSHSLLQDRLQHPPEPLARLATSSGVGASAVGRRVPTAPAGAGFGQELASSSGLAQLPGPLTTPPASSSSLPRSPGSALPVPIAGEAGQDPHIRVLGQLKDQAWLSPADCSRFLAYTVQLQEVVGKLCGNQATHLHDQCAEQGAESKGALGWASQDLLSSCQALLSTEQPLTEVQCALRATFDRLVHLAVTCFQVTHCWQCRQRQQELGAALGDVVGTYQQLVQAVHQQLHGQVCPELGTKLLARQHTALAAAILCLLQQFRASPWL
ncbi:PREDICTED: FERM and PDZ domain-containing protein 1 [Ficedula albicollis]|uniref:FERM and PDZ domain-containing protein 1 n=1 Tax=Ficedula albicollis TaxID=59894 RepID=UPI0007AD90E6|nr:PREDICTED: FERM and PDZ domain-containing protein 1 [Ficedula albicollis]